jgi:hypothetical protein
MVTLGRGGCGVADLCRRRSIISRLSALYLVLQIQPENTWLAFTGLPPWSD